MSSWRTRPRPFFVGLKSRLDLMLGKKKKKFALSNELILGNSEDLSNLTFVKFVKLEQSSLF